MVRVGPRPLPLYLWLLQVHGVIDSWQATLKQQFMQRGGGFDADNFAAWAGMMPENAAMQPLMQQMEQWRSQLGWPLSQMQDDPLNMVEAGNFLAGVQKYQTYPWQRTAPNHPVVTQVGRVRLLQVSSAEEEGHTPLPPVVLVPSVINKAYIFDLLPQQSLAQFLAEQGHPVYVLDWGDGQQSGTPLSVERLIVQHLLPLLSQVAQRHGQPAALVGYCLGGLFALAASVVQPELVRALACVATPWDFAQTPTHKLVQQGEQIYRTLLQNLPFLPVDVVQAQFAMLSPYGAIRRMSGLLQVHEQAQLQRMVAIEDWLSDGVPLERELAHTIMFDWHLHNLPAKGAWQVLGKTISPAGLQQPLFVAIPENDVIVPKAAAVALAAEAQSSMMVKVPAGHIGLMVGRKALEKFYRPLALFLRAV